MKDIMGSSVMEAARRLGFSERKTHREIASGNLKAHRIGRNWRIFEADLQEYLMKTANVRADRGQGGGRAA
jgi:excisionase family DNA binding protein